MEGLSRGFRSKFLLLGLVGAISINLFLVENVGLYIREELIVGLGAVGAKGLLKLCAFAQTSSDDVLFHVFISTSYMNRFLVEPLDGVSKRFTSSLDNGIKGCHNFGLGWVLEAVK